jgi:tetratricopeptide (TPR) repeat protein
VELVSLNRLIVLESQQFAKRGLAFSMACGLLLGLVLQVQAQVPQAPLIPNKTALEMVSSSEYVPLSRASALLSNGENAKALNYLLETNERNPVNILGLFHLGSAYLELAKQTTHKAQQAVYLEQAQQAFERVVDLNNELTLTYFKLGKVALMKNDIDGAKQYYRAGLEVEPGNAALIFNLARVYDQNGERAEAIRYYQETIKADPNFTYAYNNLALLYEEMKDFDNAEKAYKQALKKDKQYNLARLNLGNMYAANGNYKEANALFTAAKVLEPKNEWVYYYQGNMYLRMGKFADAVDSYNQVLELNPKHATTYYLLAVSLSKLNRMEEAMQASLNYMQLAPNGEYAKEMQSLIMAVKLSQSNGLFFTRSPGSTVTTQHPKN